MLVFLGCNYISPRQILESEASVENPNRTVFDSTVFPNSEPFGMVSDLDKKRSTNLIDIASAERNLLEYLTEIFNRRESDGIRHESTNETPKGVYLIAEPELAVGSLASLYLAIAKSGGDVYIPKKNSTDKDSEPRRPDPLILIVTAGKIAPLQHMNLGSSYDPNLKFRYHASVEVARTAESLLSRRVWESSIEVSADERYFINDAQGPESDEGPRYTKVKQRAIESDAIKGEIAKLTAAGSNELLIITSDKASYASVVQILEATENQKVKFTILVRPQSFEKK